MFLWDGEDDVDCDDDEKITIDLRESHIGK